MGKSLNDTGLYLYGKRPKAKKGEPKRTRMDRMSDLVRDALSVPMWHLLGPTEDITGDKTHFLALTLRRTESSIPRTHYSLLGAEVLPWSALEAVHANRGHFSDSRSVDPRTMFEQDAVGRKAVGALGSVMVVTIEMPKGQNRPPRDALNWSLGIGRQEFGLGSTNLEAILAGPIL